MSIGEVDEEAQNLGEVEYIGWGGVLGHIRSVEDEKPEWEPIGGKIVILGEGNEELPMLQAIKGSGYQGPIGIIGHQEEEDVQEVLTRNLTGLAELQSKLK